MSNALNIIAKKLGKVLGSRGFTRVSAPGESSVVFEKSLLCYIVEYAGNVFKLSKISKNEENEFVADTKCVLAEWLFDPSVSNEKDAEDIANDFCKFFLDSKADDHTSMEASNLNARAESDGLHFFLNRLMTAFPELKDLAKKEKKEYVRFRYVTFVKKRFVPLFLSLVVEGNDVGKLRKLVSVLNNFYENGNMDVRSTITMVILNSLEGVEVIDKIKKLLSKDLSEAFFAGYKYRNKKVKPEKVRKSFLSRFLSASKSG